MPRGEFKAAAGPPVCIMGLPWFLSSTRVAAEDWGQIPEKISLCKGGQERLQGAGFYHSPVRVTMTMPRHQRAQCKMEGREDE
jgi:hypothetical protein